MMEIDRVDPEPNKCSRNDAETTNQGEQIGWSRGAAAVISNITDKQRSNERGSATKVSHNLWRC